MRFLYNTVLILFTLVSLPKFLWEMVRHRKHRRSFFEKLGFKLPNFQLPPERLHIWIHSVSVGETKAVAPLVGLLRQRHPQACFVISTTTETGLSEAQRSMPGLDHYFYLPVDFSWTIRRLVGRLNPHLLILVESDFWLNLVSEVEHVVVVNGKISETSLTRFLLFPFFTKRLFGAVDHFCVQSSRFAKRFEALGVDPAKITVTGNLKFDQPLSSIDKAQWRKEFGIHAEDRVIVIGSTHETEEESLIDALAPLLASFPTLKIMIAPRHPERFSQVAALLEKKKIANVILIDKMGVLSGCYQLAEIAVVGGSFISSVGGHNIFEPAALGVPVLFGPHMESQKDLVDLIVHSGAGKQVSLEAIAATVDSMLRHPPEEMRQAGLQLAKEVHGAVNRSYGALLSFIS